MGSDTHSQGLTPTAPCDRTSGRCVHVIKHPDGGVLPVALRPDSETVLTSCRDGTARFWRVSTGDPIAPILRHRTEVVGAAFSTDGKTVLTGCFDGTARLWDRATASPLAKILQQSRWVHALAFSPDDRTVLAGGQAGIARFWDVTRRLQVNQPIQRGHWISSAAISPDGRPILIGCTIDLIGGTTEPTASFHDLPRPIQGEPRMVTLWVEAVTELTLGKGDVIRPMVADKWQRRRALMKRSTQGEEHVLRTNY